MATFTAHPNEPVVLPSIHEILPPHLLPRRLRLATPAALALPLTYPAPELPFSSDPEPMTLPPIASTSNWRRSPAFGTPSPPPPTLHPPNLPSEPSLSPAQSHSELSGSSSHDSDGDTEMNEASEGEGDAETAPRQGKGKGKGEPKKHVCMICSRRFNRPSSLRIHGNTHSGAMPFSCPHPGCGRAFNVKSNMRRHLRNHTSEPEDASGTMLLFHNTYHSSSGLSTSLPTPLAGTATVGVTPYVDAAFSAQAALSAKRLANRSQPQFLPASPSPPVAVEAERVTRARSARRIA